MKVALVCDWLTNVGGAEKVLLELHQMYPKAPIYTSKYSKKGIDWFDDADVRTGWLQIFPAKMRRLLGPLRQRWFSKLDLSEYDLIISVTGAEAKSVKSGKWLHAHGKKAVNPKGIHISFCHVPTQYYWQMYDEYVKDPGFSMLNPVVRFFFKLMVKPLKKADFEAAQRPDYYITISEYAKGLIKRYYGREAVVIHPPVEIDDFRVKAGPVSTSFSEVMGLGTLECHTLDRGQNRPNGRTCPGRQEYTSQSSKSGLALRPQKKTYCHPLSSEYYIITSRQVNWKRIDLAIKACLKLGRKLMVVGEGPEHKKLVKLAEGSDLIEFVPLVDKTKLAELLAGAKGYIFPSLEPFGIAPVEALAAGCPVIAFGEGGVLDYVKDGKNGVLFEKQTVKSLAEAMTRFEGMKFDRMKVSESADGYSVKRFEKEIRSYVEEKLK